MVAAIKSVGWPRSSWNTWPPCLGIRNHLLVLGPWTPGWAVSEAVPEDRGFLLKLIEGTQAALDVASCCVRRHWEVDGE